MFRVGNNVPDVYMNESRDFQLFSRLYDLVFQSSRFSIDSLEQVADTMRCNDAILPLIASKVGFFTDLNLTSKADRQILSAFPHIIRYKGSIKGVQLVSNLFERIMNTNVSVELDDTAKNRVIIVFDNYTPNIDLLSSLLEYIRPTGLLIDYAVKTDLKFGSDYVSSDVVTIRTLRGTDVSGKDLEYVAQVVSENKDNPDLASNVGFAEIVQVGIDETTEEK